MLAVGDAGLVSPTVRWAVWRVRWALGLYGRSDGDGRRPEARRGIVPLTHRLVRQ